MKSILELGPKSLVFTSGTLGPVKSFSAELGIKFNHVLENSHVIDPKQVKV